MSSNRLASAIAILDMYELASRQIYATDEHIRLIQIADAMRDAFNKKENAHDR